jgi:hypothetical protein
MRRDAAQPGRTGWHERHATAGELLIEVLHADCRLEDALALVDDAWHGAEARADALLEPSRLGVAEVDVDVLELRRTRASSVSERREQLAASAGLAAGAPNAGARASSATSFSCIASHARCANGQRRLPKNSRPHDSSSFVGASVSLSRQSARSTRSRSDGR